MVECCGLYKDKQTHHTLFDERVRSSEFIIERIIDRWTEYIDYRGTLYCACIPSCIGMPAKFERIDVKNAWINFGRNKDGFYGSRLHLDVDFCLLNNRRPSIQGSGYVEIDLNQIPNIKRLYVGREHVNIRLSAKIEPICVDSMTGKGMQVRLVIAVCFVLSKYETIWNQRNAFCNKDMEISLYPQPIKQ